MDAVLTEVNTPVTLHVLMTVGLVDPSTHSERDNISIAYYLNRNVLAGDRRPELWEPDLRPNCPAAQLPLRMVALLSPEVRACRIDFRVSPTTASRSDSVVK